MWKWKNKLHIGANLKSDSSTTKQAIFELKIIKIATAKVKFNENNWNKAELS